MSEVEELVIIIWMECLWTVIPFYPINSSAALTVASPTCSYLRSEQSISIPAH